MTPTLSEVLEDLFTDKLQRVYTALPATIETFDGKNKASIKPLINYIDDNGEAHPLSVINNVPVVFPQSNNSIIAFPLSKGDGVLAVFSKSSLDEWLSSGGETAPKHNRQFDYSDAIAIPGLFPISYAPATIPDGLTINHMGNTIDIKDDSSINITSASGAMITLTDAGDIEVDNGSGKIIVESLTGNIKLNGGTAGTIAIGNSLAELLDLFNQTLTQIQAITVVTALGPQPIVNLAAFTAIQAQLALIKGTL